MKRYIINNTYMFRYFGIIALLVLTFCLYSCRKTQEVTPIYALFNITLLGRAPDASLGINNYSLVGTSYHWSIQSDSFKTVASAKRWPDLVLIKKPSQITITLIDSFGKEVQTVSQIINVPGYDSVLYFHNITFGLHYGDSVYGRFFSTKTRLMYKDKDINATSGDTIVPQIDLIFGSYGDVLFYMISPNDTFKNANFKANLTYYNDSVARNNLSFQGIDSIVNNAYYFSPPVSVYFDSIVNDRFFYRTNLSVSNNKHIPLTSMLNSFILFQNAAGKKGLIRPTYMDANKITVDIKMQKY